MGQEYEATLRSPVGCAWSSLLSASFFPLSKETQFALIHDTAKVVYRKLHTALLDEMGSIPGVSTCEEHNPLETRSDNLLPPLLRMCGSQLQSIYAVKSKELEKLEKREALSSADINRIKQELKFVDFLSMNEDQKKTFAQSLPSTDRGRMRFPIPEIHTFLVADPTSTPPFRCCVYPVGLVNTTCVSPLTPST